MKLFHPIILFEYFIDFFLYVLTAYVAVSLADALSGGEKFTLHWQYIIFIILPLFMIGRFGVDFCRYVRSKNV